MKNEPVAYIPFAWYCAWFGNSAEPVWEQYEECHPSAREWDNFPDKIIPLYTHPAKTLEPDCYGDGNVYRGVRSKDSAIQTIHIDSTAKTLTDEEILEIRHKYRTKLVDGNYRVDELEFARAILRKAQEK